MSKLKYKTVFDKYNKSFSDYLAKRCYYIYKRIRFSLERFFPIKEYEMIKHNDNYNRPSSKMPAGYNYITNSVEDGYVDLKYIDFYDYLPKEYIEKFKKEFFYYVSKYGLL